MSEATVTEIGDFRNECARETEDNLNSRLLQNYREVNKVFYLKKKSPEGLFHPILESCL